MAPFSDLIGETSARSPWTAIRKGGLNCRGNIVKYSGLIDSTFHIFEVVGL